MKQRIKKFADNLWEKYVIHKYVKTGLHWGDLTSYTFLGEPEGYIYLCKDLEYWEAEYKKLGYIPLDRRRWVDAGGYGKDYQSLLKIRQ